MASPVLIVDDEEDIRDLLTTDLKRRGFDVTSASNGTEAFAILEKKPEIELVISDVMMPNGNGVELLKKIKAKNMKRPAVIMLTGFSDVKAAELLKMGAFHVFFKPYNRTQFFETIQRAIESSR